MERSSLRVCSIFNPFLGEPAIVFGIVKRLEGQPVGLMEFGVFIVDSLLVNII